MITALHGKDAARGWEFSLFHVFDPGAVYTDREVMLLLARHGASVTADAFPVVDDKAVIGHRVIINHGGIRMNTKCVRRMGAPAFSPASVCAEASRFRGTMLLANPPKCTR